MGDTSGLQFIPMPVKYFLLAEKFANSLMCVGFKLLSTNQHSKFRQELVEMIPGLRRFAYGLTGSTSDGDDLVQATLERAINREHQLLEDKSLYGWVFSILRSTWKNELRSRMIRRGNGSVNVDLLPDESDLASQEKLQLKQNLHDRVMALPEDFRSALLLIDVVGFSYTEAAEVLNIPKGTLMSRLARARTKLIDTETNQSNPANDPHKVSHSIEKEVQR